MEASKAEDHAAAVGAFDYFEGEIGLVVFVETGEDHDLVASDPD